MQSSRRARAVQVAVAAGSILVALTACGTSTAHRGTATGPPSPGPVVVDLDASAATSLDLAGMDVGPKPSVPWVEGQVLHTGTADVPVGPSSLPLGYDGIVHAFGPGALRGPAELGQDKRLEFLDADGAVTRSVPASATALSPDGSRVAWWEYETHELVIADTATGDVVRRIPGPDDWALLPWRTAPRLAVSVDGWLGPDDLLVRWNTQGRDPRGGSWRTSGEPVPSWSEPDETLAGYSTAAGVVLRYSRPAEYIGGNLDTRCLDATDLDSGALRWRHCYQHDRQTYSVLVSTFSPDAAHLLVGVADGTGGHPAYELVLDTATGKPVATFDSGLQEGDEYGYSRDVMESVFEGDGQFLAVVSNLAHRSGKPTGSATEAIVRCTVTGGCERTTAVETFRLAVGGSSPYRLY